MNTIHVEQSNTTLQEKVFEFSGRSLIRYEENMQRILDGDFQFLLSFMPEIEIEEEA